MDNFIKYYSYFVSEYIVEEFYNDFVPNENMVSSGVNMLSYIADLGTEGEVEHSNTDDLYEAITRVVQAIFTDTTQYFITNDRKIIKIEDLTLEDIIKITNDLITGMDSEEFLHKLDSGDYWFRFAEVNFDDVDTVGRECLSDVYTKPSLVGVIPPVESFIAKVRKSMESDYKTNESVNEDFIEEEVYSILDFV